MVSKRRKSTDGGASGGGTKSPATAITDRCETRAMAAARRPNTRARAEAVANSPAGRLTPSIPAAATDSPPKRRRKTPSTPAAATDSPSKRGRPARAVATDSPPRRRRSTPSTPAAATDSPPKRVRPAKAVSTDRRVTRNMSRLGQTPSPKAKKGRKPKKEVGQGSTMAEADKEDVLLGLKTEETTKTEAAEGSKKAETKEIGEGSTMAEAEETGEGSKMVEIKETGEGSKMVETGQGSKMAVETTTEEETKTIVDKGKATDEVEETGSGSAVEPLPTIIIDYWTGHDLFVTRALEVKLALEEGAPGITVLLNPDGEPKPRCFKIQIVGGDTCIDFKKLESPFILLRKNDAQKFASNVLGRILPSN